MVNTPWSLKVTTRQAIVMNKPSPYIFFPKTRPKSFSLKTKKPTRISWINSKKNPRSLSLLWKRKPSSEEKRKQRS